MTVNRAFILFEQSGTFRDAFRSLGIDAECYDIADEFGKTDHVVDLFAEIDRAFDGRPSVFDAISSDDLVMAFFPCTYFETRQMVYFNITSINLARRPDDKYSVILTRLRQREHHMALLYKLLAIAEKRGLKMIIENPAQKPHFLLFETNFIKPTYIDTDRRRRGDYFKKPTAFWFVGCEPTEGMTRQTANCRKTVDREREGISRSLMSPDYARNFICDKILGRKETRQQLKLNI